MDEPFDWNGPLTGIPQNWVKLEAGLPFTRTLEQSAELGSKSSAMKSAVSSTWDEKTLENQCGQLSKYHLH